MEPQTNEKPTTTIRFSLGPFTYEAIATFGSVICLTFAFAHFPATATEGREIQNRQL